MLNYQRVQYLFDSHCHWSPFPGWKQVSLTSWFKSSSVHTATTTLATQRRRWSGEEKKWGNILGQVFSKLFLKKENVWFTNFLDKWQLNYQILWYYAKCVIWKHDNYSKLEASIRIDVPNWQANHQYILDSEFLWLDAQDFLQPAPPWSNGAQQGPYPVVKSPFRTLFQVPF